MPDQIPQDQLSDTRILRMVSTTDAKVEEPDYRAAWYLGGGIFAGLVAFVFTQCQSWWAGDLCGLSTAIMIYYMVAARFAWTSLPLPIDNPEGDEDGDVDQGLDAQQAAHLDAHYRNLQ